MTKGRHTKTSSKDGRRCSKPGCRKLAKDLINDEYLCRLHSPMRAGFEKAQKEKLKEKKKK